jgi:hypothetical protein
VGIGIATADRNPPISLQAGSKNPHCRINQEGDSAPLSAKITNFSDATELSFDVVFTNGGITQYAGGICDNEYFTAPIAAHVLSLAIRNICFSIGSRRAECCARFTVFGFTPHSLARTSQSPRTGTDLADSGLRARNAATAGGNSAIAAFERRAERGTRSAPLA